jgi:hypothetical protein
MCKKVTLIWALMCMFVMTSLAANKRFTLVIDPGHGGHDAGALGAISKEKNINLAVALRFGKYVELIPIDILRIEMLMQVSQSGLQIFHQGMARLFESHIFSIFHIKRLIISCKIKTIFLKYETFEQIFHQKTHEKLIMKQKM